MGQTVSIGARLREERQRISMNQTAFAEHGGVTKKTQMLYESGDRCPDAAYLAAVCSVGVDVQYVVTGERQGHGIGPSAVHQAVLDAVDLLSLETKIDGQQLARAVVKLCARQHDSASTSGAAPASAKFVVHGNVAQQVDAAAGSNFIVNVGKTHD